MHNLTQYFAQFGSPVGAQGRAFGYIGHLIADQAALMAYIDIFYSWSTFAAVLVPVVLVLISAYRAGQRRRGVRRPLSFPASHAPCARL